MGYFRCGRLSPRASEARSAAAGLGKSLEAAMQKGYSRNRQGKAKYRKRREGGRTQERRREEKGGEARTEKDYEQTEDS